MPSSSRSRIVDSELEAGPRVQIILARRTVEDSSRNSRQARLVDLGRVPLSKSNLSSVTLRAPALISITTGCRDPFNYLGATLDSCSSDATGPLINTRGNSMALNSAPIRTTSDTMYIHTRSAMPTPSEP